MSELRLSLVLSAQAEQAKRELASTTQAISGVKAQAEGAAGGLGMLGLAGNQAGGQLRTAGAANDNFARSTSAAAQGMVAQAEATQEVTEALTANTSAANVGAGALSRLAGIAVTAAAAIAATMSFGAYKNIADDWSDMSSRIGAAVKDMEAAPGLMQEMLRLANASYSGLGQTVEGFAANVGALRDLGLSTQEALDYTESLNHALVITATKGQQAASVQHALSKAMAVGRLQADGLETVLANGGRVAEALADELGTTVSGLRDMASEGRITGQVIAQALLKALSDVRREAGEMPTTIADGFLKIGNSVTALVGSIDKELGLSEAVAGHLNSIAEAIADLAQSDFSGLMASMASGVETLSQVLLVVAATRIPVLIGALGALNLSTALMTGQFVAGAIASRGITAAMAMQAAGARGLAAAMALAGGPVGLLAAGVTALGFGLWNAKVRADEIRGSLASLSGAQDAVNASIETFYKERTPESLRAMVALAEGNAALASAALAAAQNELESSWNPLDLEIKPGFSGRFFGIQLWDTENLQEGRDHLSEAQAQVEQTEAALGRVRQIASEYESSLSGASGHVAQLTLEQQKSLATANEMLRGFERRTELARLETAYGQESVAYQVAQVAHERELLTARLNSLDITQAQRNAVLGAWEAAMRAEGATVAWDTAMSTLLSHTQAAYTELRNIANGEPPGGWLDGAIGKARLLAGALLAGVGALADLSTQPLDDAGNPIPAGVTRRRPRSAPVGIGGIDWGTAPEPAGGAGSARAPDREREAVEDLIKSLELERDVLRELDPIQQEMIRHRDVLAAATDQERQQVEELIRTRNEEAEALDRVKSQMEDVRQLGHDVVRGLINDLREGASAGDIFANVLDRIADKLLDMGATGIADVLFGAKGSSGGGLLGGFLGGLFGVKMNAMGDVVGAPTLFAYGDQPGQLGMMGEAGPEAIMPLTHANGQGVGAIMAGRETTLPLIRLGSGKLGVEVPAPQPFAMGGTFGHVPAPPQLASHYGHAAGRASEGVGGQARLVIEPSPDFRVRLEGEMEGIAMQVGGRLIQQYDQHMPDRIERYSLDPAYKG